MTAEEAKGIAEETLGDTVDKEYIEGQFEQTEYSTMFIPASPLTIEAGEPFLLVYDVVPMDDETYRQMAKRQWGRN